MKNINNENLLTKVNKIYKDVKMEARNLTFPSVSETILSGFFLLFLASVLCGYFLFIGKIAMFFLKFIGA
jgi:hypothetical protein